MGEADRELAERVARLEAEVARLGDLLKPRGLQPPPRPPYPPPVPPRPRRGLTTRGPGAKAPSR